MRISIIALATLLQLASASQVEWGREFESEPLEHDSQATPLRRRTTGTQSLHKSHEEQRQQQQVKADEAYDVYLGLAAEAEADNEQEYPQRQRRMQMSMPVEEDTSCSFCPTEGLAVDPSFEIPGTGVSCGLIMGTVQFLEGGTEDCMNAQMAQGICCPVDYVDASAAVEEEAMMSMPMSMPLLPTVCSFCPEGLDDPTFVLPTDDQATCAQAAGFAASLNPEDATCTTVQLAEAFCCPPGDDDEDLAPPVIITSTAATEMMVTTTAMPLPELEDGHCSCSPLVYNFELAFDQDCDTDDLEGKAGVEETFCFLGATSAGGRLRRLRHNPSLRMLKKNEEPDAEEVVEFTKEDNEVRFISIEDDTMYSEPVDRQLQESLEIISIQFLEFDTTGNLLVINQDDTYSETSLVNGDTFTFKSISNDLDPMVAIGDQLDLLPGGVQVTLRGRVFDTESNEMKIVSNRITWRYSNGCGDVPVEGGESIGWTTITDVTPASEAFCPALRPVMTTDAPTIPAITTEVPVVTTAPEVTVAPPDEGSMPPSGGVFGKSGKGGKGSKSSKSTKAKKKSVSPKTNKTPKNPMAKVHKASSTDDGHQDGDSSSMVDTKSGKAKVDMDAKAEKSAGSSKAKKESSDADDHGKSGKLAKTSSKGAKVSSSSKSGKSSKSSSKAPKATKLFKEPMPHDGADMPEVREEDSMSM